MINRNNVMNKIIHNSKEAELTNRDKKNLRKLVKRLFIYKECLVYGKRKFTVKRTVSKYIDCGYDKTEIEYTINEILLSEFIPLDVERMELINQIFIYLKELLEEKYPEKPICIVFSLQEDLPQFSPLRIHTYRDSEGLYISEQIDGYNQPVMYDVFGV